MNREMIVQKLIESQVDYITRHGCGLWLHDILERGFMGFGNMSDEQLLMEMRQRGVRDEFENKPWPLDEEDDDETESDEDENEDVRRLLEERVTDGAQGN